MFVSVWWWCPLKVDDGFHENHGFFLRDKKDIYFTRYHQHGPWVNPHHSKHPQDFEDGYVESEIQGHEGSVVKLSWIKGHETLKNMTKHGICRFFCWTDYCWKIDRWMKSVDSVADIDINVQFPLNLWSALMMLTYGPVSWPLTLAKLSHVAWLFLYVGELLYFISTHLRNFIPSLKLTVRPWKWMVGILVSFWGPAYFQGRNGC